mmetsp:Transcript_4432/g.4455  ORF Transcript_4432/g.4455 Transcript_4432/m.4455 type:complete len:304 (+) Transcript_4432:99-1010(+)
MLKRETTDSRFIRKRMKIDFNKSERELENKYDEHIPKESRLKLTKAFKTGEINSYSADSKAVLMDDSFEKAIKLFEKTDPALSDFIKSSPDENTLMDVKMSAYETIVKMIISQQLSTNSASSIMTNFVKLFLKESDLIEPDHQFNAHPYFPKPEIVRETSTNRLRSAGISYRKAGYLISISEIFLVENCPFHDDKALKKKTNGEIANLLLEIKGIGPWGVEIFLLIYMKRSDVFPIHDKGIRKGLSIILQNTQSNKKKKLKYLTIKEMKEHSENWKPYRSVAAWYLMKLTSPERVTSYLDTGK